MSLYVSYMCTQSNFNNSLEQTVKDNIVIQNYYY